MTESASTSKMHAQGPTGLLDGFSLEMTGRDIPELERAAPLIPAGTQINVTFLATENLDLRVAAARAVLSAGAVPVPHIAARRISSAEELDCTLAALQEAGAAQRVFVVGGDPSRPMGAYSSSRDVIESDLLAKHHVQQVSIAGYPEGHPDIDRDTLWRELEAKSALLKKQGLRGEIITQFGFDEKPIIEWVHEVRERGISTPIRIGVPGPAGVKRLVGFARRFGISANASIVKKYGFSLGNLMGTAGPDRLISALERDIDSRQLGEVRLHFYTFGGVETTAKWISSFRG
ncbi:methylenetetrahydrofolate reductase [Microbacterium oryzae]|uniref:methylenetetrahydrofolate reductase n=1 Tax=Microbacterium oryzae TaxID=743009 RepID=UPI0025B25719|nr:methylenetetrahydrofolate reductase [Microbacterium oryzae]MDN3312112.1 methylenetetrahydrofolate reductase [Microbacterium oryzae]